jgi:hypothetical protein
MRLFVGLSLKDLDNFAFNLAQDTLELSQKRTCETLHPGNVTQGKKRKVDNKSTSSGSIYSLQCS